MSAPADWKEKLQGIIEQAASRFSAWKQQQLEQLTAHHRVLTTCVRASNLKRESLQNCKRPLMRLRSRTPLQRGVTTEQRATQGEAPRYHHASVLVLPSSCSLRRTTGSAREHTIASVSCRKRRSDLPLKLCRDERCNDQIRGNRCRAWLYRGQADRTAQSSALDGDGRLIRIRRNELWQTGVTGGSAIARERSSVLILNEAAREASQ